MVRFQGRSRYRARVTLPTRHVRHYAVLLVLAALVLSACSAVPDTNASGSAALPSQVAPSSVPASTTTVLDARAVLTALTAENLGITNGAVQDENTDPNNLIGRPGQYLSRASFDLPGGDPTGDKYGIDRGGVIECFAMPADAAARYKYIDGITRSNAMLAEYHYLNGTVIVRLAKGVKPSAAAKFETAVKALRT